MASNILDGKGRGYLAEVDKNNRLHTRAITANENVSATIEGDAYIAATGIVEITNDTDNYLIYVKNNSDKDLVLSATTVVSGESTGGSSNELTLIGKLNPTSGTIISGGTAVAPFNLNLGSANTFDGDSNIALSTMGLTASGGTPTDGFIQGSGRHIFETTIILPRGASIAGGIKAASGNTSLNVSISYSLYFRDKEIV